MANYFTPDTNILVRSWTQGKSGCEMDHWETIRKKCEAGELTMLVTEVVLLEAESQWQELLDEIDTKLMAVKKSLQDMFASKPHDWSEIKDVGQALIDQVDRSRADKRENAKKNHDEIDAILKASFARLLPFTSDVHFRARRRLLSGRFPRAKERYSEADCAIIESLCEHFENEQGEHSLLFCSENHTDFGTAVNKRFHLHPILKDGLPPTELFLNLSSLIDYLNKDNNPAEVSARDVDAAAEPDRTRKIDTQASKIINKQVMDDIEVRREQLIFPHGFTKDESPKEWPLSARAKCHALSLFLRVKNQGMTGCVFDTYFSEMRQAGYQSQTIMVTLDKLLRSRLIRQFHYKVDADTRIPAYCITDSGYIFLEKMLSSKVGGDW